MVEKWILLPFRKLSMLVIKRVGGTVLVPAGTYLSATIVLKDNVTLHLEKGCLFYSGYHRL